MHLLILYFKFDTFAWQYKTTVETMLMDTSRWRTPCVISGHLVMLLKLHTNTKFSTFYKWIPLLSSHFFWFQGCLFAISIIPVGCIRIAVEHDKIMLTFCFLFSGNNLEDSKMENAICLARDFCCVVKAERYIFCVFFFGQSMLYMYLLLSKVAIKCTLFRLTMIRKPTCNLKTTNECKQEEA